MWIEVFEKMMQSGALPIALLRGSVFPSDIPPYERASAVMAAQMAVASLQKKQRLILMAPPPTENLPRVVSAGILISHLVYERGMNDVFHKEKPLLEGDLLLVTHAVGSAIDELRNLHLGGVPLYNIWSVASYSRYTPVDDERPRVFVANAGWVLDGLPRGRLAAMVIDATNPRTLVKLPQLLYNAEDLRIVIAVTPPLLEMELKRLGFPGKINAWLWDPEAKRSIAELLSHKERFSNLSPTRNIWICDNREIDRVLEEIYEILAECQREWRKPFPPLLEAWSLYHRFRQLTVPLAQLEETSFSTRGALPFKKRLERLCEVWPHDVFLESRWHRLTRVLIKAYDILLKIEEPPKFWSVAERVTEALGTTSKSHLRIVVPTVREGMILSLLLSQLEEEWMKAQQEGRIEIITPKEEARFSAMGKFGPTMLLGYRASSQRYLDLYPPYDTEVIAYPHEAVIDQIYQERIYEFAERLQEDHLRKAVLHCREISGNSIGSGKKSQRPDIFVIGTRNYEIRKAKVLHFEPSLFDIDHLADLESLIAWDEEVREANFESKTEMKGSSRKVEVVFNDGRKVNYAPWQSVYVYYPIIEQVRRCSAIELQPELQLVVLVDAVYEGLYERLLEAIRSRISPHTLIVLDLWDKAKYVILQKHGGNRRDLHRALQQRGLQVGYEALTAYFQGDDLEEQGLAPQQYRDMRILAEYSGLYKSEETIRLTFSVIQEERKRRRNAGRVLHTLLRAIVTGKGYEQALEGARKIGHEIAEVLAAVEVRTIEKVRIIDCCERT